MLSHFDADHIDGIKDLLAGVRVDYLVLPYLRPEHRLELAASYGEGRPEFTRFLFDPIAYVRETLQVENVVLVLPGEEGPPEDSLQVEGPLETPPGFSTDPKKSDKTRNPGNGMSPNEPFTAGSNLFVDGSNPFLVAGCWEFVFYNKPRPEREARIREGVEHVFQEFSETPNEERDYDALIRRLKPIYKRVFGSSGRAQNDISLVAYSGPV